MERKSVLSTQCPTIYQLVQKIAMSLSFIESLHYVTAPAFTHLTHNIQSAHEVNLSYKLQVFYGPIRMVTINKIQKHEPPLSRRTRSSKIDQIQKFL